MAANAAQGGFGQHSQYHRPSWERNQQPHLQNLGPPPHKKQKSNVVITRYPPPPGYQGPVQAYGPSGSTAWQLPPQSPAYAPPGLQHQRSYSVPQPFGQTPHPGYQTQQHLVAVHQPPHSFYPSPQTPGFPQTQHSWKPPPSTHSTSQNQWQQPTSRHHAVTSSALLTPNSAAPLDGNGEPLPPLASPENENTIESEFDGECYFARHPDQIDPNFSIGQIEWKAPLHTRLALPSTFAEAELEALAPRKPPPLDETSVSEYFFRNKRDEAFLSVRQTDVWLDVKNDTVFKELPAKCQEFLSMSELFDQYRYRLDPNWSEFDEDGVLASQRPSRHNTPSPTRMEIDSTLSTGPQEPNSGINMLSSLEYALSAADNTPHLQAGRSMSVTSVQSSTKSQHHEKLTRPKPLPIVRDQAQEDMLAALGVTGSPKMVYETPGPAIGPPANSAKHSRVNSVASAQSNMSRPHSRSTREHSVSHETWPNETARPVSVPLPSEMDTMDEDNEVTPRPKLKHQDSRKRGFEEAEDGEFDDNRWADDGATPKQRYKQQRV